MIEAPSATFQRIVSSKSVTPSAEANPTGALDGPGVSATPGPTHKERMLERKRAKQAEYEKTLYAHHQRERMDALKAENWGGSYPDLSLGNNLAFAVAPMGWSWAVFLAQTFLVDQVVQIPGMEASRLLVEGAPWPLVSAGHPYVGFVHIDDYGLIAFVKLTRLAV